MYIAFGPNFNVIALGNKRRIVSILRRNGHRYALTEILLLFPITAAPYKANRRIYCVYSSEESSAASPRLWSHEEFLKIRFSLATPPASGFDLIVGQRTSVSTPVASLR